MTVQAATVSISDLKKVKNSVIGNPLAKDGIAGDEGLMRTLIDSIGDSANDVPEDIKTEAAHIVASLSYGSELALSTLLKLNTPYVFVFALSKVSADGSAALRAAYARALRALVSSIADVVGPSEYGLRPETPSSLRLETKEALDGMFTVRLPPSGTHSCHLYIDRQLDTLDTILPLLLSPSQQIVTPIVQLIGSATRSSVHRSILVSWLPPDERRKEQGKAKKRGWEKLSASSSASPNTDVKLQEAVLLAMAALAKENGPVAVGLGRGLGLGPDVHGITPLALVLNYTKSRNVEVQLAACLCATHIIRGVSSTHLPPTSSSNHGAILSYAQSVYASLPLDDACIRAVVNMVNRVVGAEGLGDVERRVKACFVLYHLTTDDKALCQFAFERGCLDTLAGAIKSITPPDPVSVPAQAAQEGLAWRWDESESEGVTRLREAALTAIATLTLFSDAVRRAITGTHGLLPYISTALKQGLPPSALVSTSNSTPTKRTNPSCGATGRARRTDHTPGVRYAACQCVRVLARGVAVLRTNIVDSGLGMEVFRIVVRGAKSTSTREDGAERKGGEEEGEPEDRRVLNAALAAVCNIVMEFSPLRPIYLEQGLMPRLVQLLLHSGDSAIRMNALWAIKNLLYKSSTETKRDVMRELGWLRVFELLHDPDLGIQEQAYHVVRNLSETEDGIEMVFREMGADAILDSITESISLESGMMMTTPVSPTSPSTSSTGAGPSTSSSSTAPSYPPVTHPLQDRTPTILQAISTLANLCNGPPNYTSLILSKPQLLMNLKTCLAECGAEIRKVGVSCVLTLVVRVGPSSYALPNWPSVCHALDSFYSFDCTSHRSYVPDDEPSLRICSLVDDGTGFNNAPRFSFDDDGKHDCDVPWTRGYLFWRASWNRRLEWAQWGPSPRLSHYWAWDGCCDVPAWVPSSEFASSACDNEYEYECGETGYGHHGYADGESGSVDESCEEFADRRVWIIDDDDDSRINNFDFNRPTASSLSDDGADYSDADASQRLVLWLQADGDRLSRRRLLFVRWTFDFDFKYGGDRFEYVKDSTFSDNDVIEPACALLVSWIHGASVSPGSPPLSLSSPFSASTP
ncbi:hypothetical protein EST38_g8091 [Candolleomyces aberdarensis]|uniref:Armadillo repeat-containing protein 8 n=1 Tax=Candolleomyces aberdarensis TaxID=2316362 RepID=A0A4Q2DDG4_9AGAR|nr:hypothetical protein EST38_g8091 [Candolleomyces aberdarensis]